MGITSREAMFIILLFKHKWSIDAPYPSFETVARLMGKSRNTVQRYARKLEKKGILKRHYRQNQPSAIDLNPLIRILNFLSDKPNLDREAVQNCMKVYPKLDTKKDPLKQKRNKKLTSIKEYLGTYKKGAV